MARRKKKNTIINIFLIILIVVLGLIIVKAIDNHRNKETNKMIKEEKTKIKETKKNKDENKKESTEDTKKEKEQISQKPSSDENEENKNEINRRNNSNISLDIIGEDELTISVGSEYIDSGFKATYEDGSDASSEVKVDNAVDTSKAGTYTVTYSVGNTIIIRRVIVK